MALTQGMGPQTHGLTHSPFSTLALALSGIEGAPCGLGWVPTGSLPAAPELLVPQLDIHSGGSGNEVGVTS